MQVPTDIASALIVVVLVVPGFVYGSVRAYFRAPTGPHDTQLSFRIAIAVMISVVFDAAYLIALGLAYPRAEWVQIAADPAVVLPREPHLLGLAVLILGFAIPAAAALVAYCRIEWRRAESAFAPNWLRRPTRRGGYRNFPTAWSRAAPGLGGTFVRVRLRDGKWIGGWFSSGSFVSTHPHPRDLYIERQYNMEPDGRFAAPVEGSVGVWLAIGDEDVVEWVLSLEASPDEEET